MDDTEDDDLRSLELWLIGIPVHYIYFWIFPLAQYDQV
jgi:hypothetical protein